MIKFIHPYVHFSLHELIHSFNPNNSNTLSGSGNSNQSISYLFLYHQSLIHFTLHIIFSCYIQAF